MKSPKFTTAFAASLLFAALLSPAAHAQTKMEVPWLGLAQALDGHVVNTVLLDGTALRGRVLDVSENELRFKIKETSKPVVHPKGEMTVRKGQVKVFSYTYRNGSGGRIIGTAIGGAAGLVPTLLVASITKGEGGNIFDVDPGVGTVLTGIAAAGVSLGYGVGHVVDTKTMTVFVAEGID